MMQHYKVLNIKNNFSTKYDYKNLNIKNIVPLTAIYPYDVSTDNYCILASMENVEHEDLIKITEEEYNTLKEEILASYPAPEPSETEVLKQQVEMQQATIDDLLINVIPTLL